MSEVTKRPVVKELCVPFDDGDERREELISIIINAKQDINVQEKKVKEQKEILKGFKDLLSVSIHELSSGRSTMVPCTQEIYWDDDKVIVRRDDNGAIVHERTIEESDRQMDVNDKDEPIDVDGDEDEGDTDYGDGELMESEDADDLTEEEEEEEEEE